MNQNTMRPAQNIQNASSPRGLLKKSLRRMSSKLSPTSAGQPVSSTVVEEQDKVKSPKQSNVVKSDDPEKLKAHEHRVDIGDEKSDLLGYEIYSGKLVLDKKSKSTSANQQAASRTGHSNGFVARLTSKALIWGSNVLHLEDVVSVTYNSGFRHFTVHAYPLNISSFGLSCVVKPRRTQKDFRFLASSPEEAIQWLHGFADQQCYVNCLPHPMASGKKQALEDVSAEPFYDLALSYIKCKSPPSIIVILNPRSGHGRSTKVFHDKVEPIFKLAGFNMQIYKTTHAGHAKEIACNADFNTCPDGIVCVGGDGIVNEVLNGLLSRENQKEAVSIPIGVIPAGSDNSLVWTVLGVRDPISAALTIVKGGLTAIDVLAVQWLQSGAIHYGTTVSYFGFLSDVLELSEKYQKRFGPLRYFVAGFLKFLCLPKYSFELEYLPMSKGAENSEGKHIEDSHKTDMLDLYNDIVRRSRKEGLQRASSLSSIDSIMTPSRMSGGDGETAGNTIASSEPSEYVRALDPKMKCLSSGRNNLVTEPDAVIHPPPPLSARTRSKSRIDKPWAGLTVTTEIRSPWAATSMYDREDISSTVSDPGPIWDSEPKWDREPKWDPEANWEAENHMELPTPPDDVELVIEKELVPNMDEKWVVKKGRFLAVLACNHSCRTVQSLSSQVVAPKAQYDDSSLDLLLVRGSGRLKLLRFFISLQFGRHLSLPYVDYVKVKSVKLKPGIISNNGCGIDGELLRVKGQVLCSLNPEQCRLIGRPVKHAI